MAILEDRTSHLCLALDGASFRGICDDHSLKERVATAQQFCEATLYISVVVAARITPGQKAEFVTMVKQRLPKAKTLAVGDGANDVNMICTAHVGVAIYGKEGLQASTASDYSVPAFKMLKPLLLHNGSEFCRINQDYIYYNFYKNFLLSVPQIG